MASDQVSSCRPQAIAVPAWCPLDAAISTHTPTFGVPAAGVTYVRRLAAYAVIRNGAGAVAAVHVPAGYWLPGGGAMPGETPAETIVREVREELGCTPQLVNKIGRAVQYFFAATDNQYYAMQAVFFRAGLAEESCGPAEYKVCWLDVSHPAPLFFHACHDWAVRQG